MKNIDLKEALKETMELYTSVFNAKLQEHGINTIAFDALPDKEKDSFLKEVDACVFKDEHEDEDMHEASKIIADFANRAGKSEEEIEAKWQEAKKIADSQGNDDPDNVIGILKRMLNLKEAVPVVTSFAEKSGKSVEEVEKLWKEAKAAAKEENRDQDYAYITGILKKMLKLNEDFDGDNDADDMGSEYYEEFDCTPVKVTALNALAMATQVHLFHLNTVSFSQHLAFKDFYEEIEDLADELIEKLLSMGYDLHINDSDALVYTFQLTNDNFDAVIRSFRDIVSEGLEATQDADHASLNDVMIDMQKLVDELLYKLTLN